MTQLPLAAFGRYLSELVTGTFGVVGDISTIVFIASYFMPGLESFRPLLFVALTIGFVLSGFRMYQRLQPASPLNQESVQAAESDFPETDATGARDIERFDRQRAGQWAFFCLGRSSAQNLRRGKTLRWALHR